MDTALLYSLLPVEIILSLFTILVGYFIISLPKSYKAKFILIPLLIVGSFFTFTWFEKVLGYPAYVSLQEQVIILSHRVTFIEDKKFIELWTLPMKDRSRSRLVIIPWTQEQEEELQRAKVKRGKKGEVIIGVPRKGRGKQQSGDGAPFFEFKNLSPRVFVPKHERSLGEPYPNTPQP